MRLAALAALVPRLRREKWKPTAAVGQAESDARRRRRLLLGPTTLASLASVSFLAGLGCSSKPTASVDTKLSARAIDVGIIGKLPPKPARRRLLVLTFPRGVVRVPGRFPLGSTVHFRVPVRNDGAKTLWLKRAESG